MSYQDRESKLMALEAYNVEGSEPGDLVRTLIECMSSWGDYLSEKQDKILFDLIEEMVKENIWNMFTDPGTPEFEEEVRLLALDRMERAKQEYVKRFPPKEESHG